MELGKPTRVWQDQLCPHKSRIDQPHPIGIALSSLTYMGWILRSIAEKSLGMSYLTMASRC